MKRYFVVILILLVSLVAISSARSFHGVSMAPNTLKGWVVASDTTGYVLHTPNCGLNWVNQSFNTGRYLYDIFFLNEQKGWICANDGFIYYSPNGGSSWYLQTMGLSYFAHRVFFLNDTCGWAACAAAIVGRTTRGNDTIINWDNWQQIILPNPPFPCNSTWFNSISFLNISTGWICAGRYPKYVDTTFRVNDTWYTKGQGYIAVSNDSGLNWQLLLRDTINDFFDINMLDSLNGYVVGGNDRTMSATVMKTQDGGVTWQPVNIPSQAKYLRSMKFQGNQAWAVGHSGTILYSTDYGNNWTFQTCPIETTLYDIDFSDSIHGLIAGDGCVLYTNNGGNTWNNSNLGVEEDLEVATLPRQARNDFVVYPNPARAYFTVRLPQMLNQVQHDKMRIKIFDVSGKLVKEIGDCFANARNDKMVRISLDGIKNGVYFIMANNDLIKEKLIVTK